MYRNKQTDAVTFLNCLSIVSIFIYLYIYVSDITFSMISRGGQVKMKTG